MPTYAPGDAVSAPDGMEYVDLSALTPSGPGAAIILSITAQPDNFYRVALVDMTGLTLQRDDIDTECAFAVEALTGDDDDLAKLFGYQLSIETKNLTTKPDIYVGAVICDSGLSEGVVFQHDEYPTGGHFSSKRGVDAGFALGASGQGGTGSVQIMKGSIQNVPTGSDMQWMWHAHVIGATVEPHASSSAQGEHASVLNVGSPVVGIVVGCKEADLGAGEFVDVRLAKKAVAWT
jgi:hypothetical protein